MFIDTWVLTVGLVYEFFGPGRDGGSAAENVDYYGEKATEGCDRGDSESCACQHAAIPSSLTEIKSLALGFYLRRLCIFFALLVERSAVFRVSVLSYPFVFGAV